ncbi:hypothetical protein TEA_001258 [Camellia sinensis var. sinensis]|uniref:R13L1/DRL21-like LRR repeat region domain-containing protein n=2 Tax=Camellia sinensis TaxID=4442 RepID=A0A4S4EYA0_CAMSN|nr:hypothetical protein TEA_001258 [Camellia sinensis var. sinensis]
MPLGIGKLASLQTLSNFIVTKNNGDQLRELGNLIYLRGRLCLSGLQNVVVPLDAREANLIDKEGLDVLSMEWSVNSDDLRDGRVETEVLDMLQPHKNLKELHIEGYLGIGFPNWIGDPLFSNMADLSLDNCGNCVSLPPLGQLPSLKKLYIKGMSVLKQVGCEFYGQGGVQPFPLLETLSFENMPEWEDWYTFGDHKEVQPFTRVKSLSIIKCPKLLKMLPTDLPCLNNLEIRDCPKLCGMMPKDLPCLNNLNISECPQFLVEGSSISLPSLTSIAMNDVPLTSLQAVLEMRSMVDDELISANAKSKHPSSITSLSIGMIKKLKLLPKWVTHGLMELEALEITCCEELKTMWKNEERVQHSLSLPAFRRLKIKGCPQLVSLFEEDEDEDNKGQHEQQQQQQEGLPCIVRRLEHLTIDNCEKLEKLPRLLHSFTFLGELYVYKCPSLSSFPETGFPCMLKTLRIGDCEALQSLFGWSTQINDSNLQVLEVGDCPSLTCLISCRGGGLPPTLKELEIIRCKMLEALLVVEEGMEITRPSLESVWIINCDRLKYLPDALPNNNNNNNNNLRNLSRLYLDGCKNLEYIPEGWFHSTTNLADLDIRGCKKLKALPHGLQSINYLTSLQSLEMNISQWNNNFKKMGIGKLASLQTLSNFILTKNSGHRLKELGNLIYLRGRLCLSGLQNVVVPLDAREANLIDKEGLDVLSMEWSVNSDDSRDGRVETEVLDMLQPHKDLKELHIKGYLGIGFPNWIGDPLFSNMADLSLDNCGNCVSLPPLGQLPSLKKLYIKGMSVLKHVDHEFYGQGSAKPFQLLETLSFKDMPEWEYWYTFEDDKEVEPFTHVSELSIKNCPKLVGMLPSYLPCLNNLKIKKCPQLLVEVSKVVHPSLTSIAMNDVPLTSLQAVLEMRSMVDDELISANAKSKHPSSITSLSIGMIKKLELSPKWVTHGLMELEALEITSCEELKSLWKNEERVQHSLSLPAFRCLKIEGCPQLVSLFEEDEDEDNKGQHEQQQQQQEGLPCIVRRLEHLTIDNCEKLEKLPRLLHSFTFLGELRVYKCPSLGSFPETGFPCTLKTLEVRDCETLQSLFGCLTQINDSNLQVLGVSDCPSLTCLISCRGGGLPPTLKQLQIIRCKKLEALLVVDEGMEITCPSLEFVLIMDCDRLKYLPDALPNNNNNLRNLSRLFLAACKNLEYIPEGWFHSATNLAELSIMDCKKLKALPHGLQSIKYLTSLQSLGMNISQWNNNFKEIGLRSLSSLRSLSITGAISVAEDEEEEDEEEEEGVAGSRFPIDGKLLPTSLIYLSIGGFRNLEKLSSKLFQNLASLEELSISGCPRLKSLPVQRLPPSLERLSIWGSRKLTRKCEKGKGKYWPHLAHIPKVDVDDDELCCGDSHRT